MRRVHRVKQKLRYRGGIWSLVIFMLVLALPRSSFGEPAPYLTGKIAVIFDPSIDQIWGTLIFGVENPSEAEAPFSFTMPFPMQMKDFKVHTGLDEKNIHLEAGEQGLRHTGLVPPGRTIVTAAFQKEAAWGEAVLKFPPVMHKFYDIVIMVAQNNHKNLSLTVPKGFKAGGLSEMGGKSYQIWTLEKASEDENQPWQILISNIPEGRASYWLMGGCFAGILILLGAVGAFATRPRLFENSEEDVSKESFNELG